MNELLSVADTARYLHVSRKTLERWHDAGHGPVRLRLGPARLAYARSDIEAWLESRRERKMQ